MASAQLMMKKEAMELTSEEKAVLDKLIEEASNKVKDPKPQQEAQDLLQKAQPGIKLQYQHLSGAIMKSTKALELHNCQTWHGYFGLSYPKKFEKPSCCFTQVGVLGKGCAAGVVYKGKNKRGDECGWLLAWSFHSRGGRKVYCDCGVIRKFDKLDWNEVKAQLDKSPAWAKHHDDETGTTALAAMAGTDTLAGFGGYLSG